jgi:tetratricopeptide (TPR) repeat protein
MPRIRAFGTMPVLLAALVLSGCSTVGPSPDEAAQSAPPDALSQFGTGESLLSHAVTLIAAATPASLAEGNRLAAAADEMGARGAAGAGIVGSTLLRRLYPESAGSYPENGLSWDEARITSPFLLSIAPALVLLDPHAAADDARETVLRPKLAEAEILMPTSPLPPFLQGLLLEKRAAPRADVRARFEAALKRSPNFSPAAAGLARTIISSGSAPSELPLLQHLASLLPTEPQRFAALARGALAAGKPEVAADAAAQGLLRAPADPAFVLLRAQALAAAGDWYQSLWVLDALLRQRPDLTDAILLKARLLHDNAQNDPESLAVLGDAETRYPADASFPEMRARILLDKGQTQEAVTALLHAHELAPEDLEILSLLVSTSAQARQWNEASSWLAMIPGPARTAENLRLGWQISNGLGDHAQALAFALQLFRMTKTADALALEARSMLAAVRPADAMVVIDHALLAMDPPPPLASELHYLRSQAGSADPLFDLRAALRENPDNAEALSAIADFLAAQKDYRKAMEYAKRASTLAPNNAALAQKARELSRLAAAAQ